MQIGKTEDANASLISALRARLALVETDLRHALEITSQLSDRVDPQAISRLMLAHTSERAVLIAQGQSQTLVHILKILKTVNTRRRSQELSDVVESIELLLNIDHQQLMVSEDPVSLNSEVPTNDSVNTAQQERVL